MHTGFTFAGVALIVAFAIFYIIMAVANAFGQADESWEDYGEYPRGTPIQQPFCFWSDLAFIAVGIVVLLWNDCTSTGNSMATPTVYSVIFGLLSVWLGPGSMLEHGTLNRTWGWFDSSSIHWWSLFTTAYLIAGWVVPPAQITDAGPVALTLALWLVAAGGIGVLTWLVPESRMAVSIIVLAVVGAALVIDAFHSAWHWFPHLPERPGGFLIGGIIALAGGIVCLFGSHRGNFLCPTDAETRQLWQWHGVWHILTAVAVLFVYLYLASH